MFATTIRRLAFATFAGFAALAAATPAVAQSSASEAAVVRVEVVAAPPAPVTRSMDATWHRAATGASTWRAEVEVERDAVITLVPGDEGQDAPIRASLTVREFAGSQLAEVELTAADESAPAELPVTLRIER